MSQPQLFEVLTALASQKSYGQITVTDICREAGISRMTFYRSYNTLDDVVAERVKAVFASYGSAFAPGGFDGKQAGLNLFKHFRAHESLLALINTGGLSALLEEELEQFMVTFSGERVQADCDADAACVTYDQAYMAGGIARVLLRWAENGMREPDSLMAQVVSEHLPNSMNVINIKGEDE